MQPKNNRRGNWAGRVGAAVAVIAAGSIMGADGDQSGVPFRDTFKPKPDAGWRWVREDPKAWRVGDGGLEVLIQPGNMWGPANDAKNVLVRPAPDPKQTPVQITAAVSNKPTGQWEQVDLVWYYDDSHMVKLGQEMVDGQLSIVMGREQADRARTINIIPIDAEHVELQLVVRDDKIRGRFKTPNRDWRDAGETDLPAPQGGKPHVSLQFYNGVPDANRWARVKEVSVRPAD
jgi:regulation of enolase protein 1 (concanavalin A-like superfamily)